MEKLFHTGKIPEPNKDHTAPISSKVQLKRQHLYLDAEVAANAFGTERQVYTVYYDNLGMLLLAPMSDATFKQAHECALVMLKDRNLNGDKSLSLQEIIIDHDLDQSDRPLPFTSAPGLKMLQVKLKT